MLLFARLSNSQKTDGRHAVTARRNKPLRVALLLTTLFVIGFFAETCHADAPLNAAQLDARIDAITCALADAYVRGRIDLRTYQLCFACRTEAQRAVTIWKHSGRDEHVARGCMAVLEITLRHVVEVPQ